MEHLISNSYRKDIELIHNDKLWGGSNTSKTKFIYEYALEHNCTSILDYGAGKSDFKISLDSSYPNHSFLVNEYEPGVPKLSHDPLTSDMTVCLDVLEHIEPEKLDNVLEHINQKTSKIFYFSACLVPSHGSFPDGRNLHLIVEDETFWLDKLSKYFTFKDLHNTKAHVWGLGIKK